MKQSVKNIGGSHIDLADGRMLEPGAGADDVEMDAMHNRTLLDAGLLAVVGSAEPEPPKTESKRER